MHIALVFVITIYLVSVAGIGSDQQQLNLCISLAPFSFGVWCHFCPSRVMPSDPNTVCKNEWCVGQHRDCARMEKAPKKLNFILEL